MNGVSLNPLASSLSGLGLDGKLGAIEKAARETRQLEKSAKDFEAVLLNKVLEEMDRSIPRSGLLDSGVTRQIQSLFWHYLSQDMADKGGLGLWKDIQGQMRRYVSGEQSAPAPQVEHTS